MIRVMLVPGDWALKGICATDASPDDWFAESYEREPYLRAKFACRGCPVRDACLSHAQITREPHGIWGGLDPDERFDLRQSKRRMRSIA